MVVFLNFLLKAIHLLEILYNVQSGEENAVQILVKLLLPSSQKAEAWQDVLTTWQRYLGENVG